MLSFTLWLRARSRLAFPTGWAEAAAGGYPVRQAGDHCRRGADL